jgi:hypothetical protein
MFIHRDLNPKTNKQNKQNSFKRKETKLPKHSQAPTSNTLNRRYTPPGPGERLKRSQAFSDDYNRREAQTRAWICTL